MQKMGRTISALLVVLGLAFLGLGQEVWLLGVEGEINRGTVSYLQSGLAAAEKAGAAAVILEFSTPGGYLDAAQVCRDLILGAKVRTIAYVNREAYSAGALLAIACEQIFFAPGGVMGAATPVYFDPQGQMQQAPEKIVSAVRALFRATAETRGRDPRVAEAMVWWTRTWKSRASLNGESSLPLPPKPRRSGVIPMGKEKV